MGPRDMCLTHMLNGHKESEATYCTSSTDSFHTYVLLAHSRHLTYGHEDPPKACDRNRGLCSMTLKGS